MKVLKKTMVWVCMFNLLFLQATAWGQESFGGFSPEMLMQMMQQMAPQELEVEFEFEGQQIKEIIVGDELKLLIKAQETDSKLLAQYIAILKGDDQYIKRQTAKLSAGLDKLFNLKKYGEFYSYQQRDLFKAMIGFSEEIYRQDPQKPGLIQQVQQSLSGIDEIESHTWAWKVLFDRTKKEQFIKDLEKTPKILRDIFKAADSYKSSVENFVNRSNLSLDERLSLLVAYVEYVVHPLRSLYVVSQDYKSLSQTQSTHDPFESLLFELSDELTNEQSENNIFITNGYRKFVGLGMTLNDSKPGFKKLAFDPQATLHMDIESILKAPTSTNYLMGMKWMTVQMMLEQMAFYKVLIRDDRPISIPQSCTTPNNIGIQRSIPFELPPEDETEMRFATLLENSGLIFSHGDSVLSSRTLDYIVPDPQIGVGFTGQLPFEKYFVANDQLNGEKTLSEAGIDDLTEYKNVLSIKLPQAQEKLAQISEAELAALVANVPIIKNTPIIVEAPEPAWDPETVIKQNNRLNQLKVDKADLQEKKIDQETLKQIEVSKRASTLDSILTPIGDESTTLMVDDVFHDVSANGKSKYILEEMVKSETDDYGPLFEKTLPALSEQMKSRMIGLKMPNYGDPEAWKIWGVKSLKDVIQRLIETKKYDEQVYNIIYRNCNTQTVLDENWAKTYCPSEYSRMSNEKKYDIFLKAVFYELDKVSRDYYYLPKTVRSVTKIEKIYPMLQTLWNQLAYNDHQGKTNYIPEAKVSEWDFTIGQADSGNNWAHARLAMMHFFNTKKPSAAFKEAAKVLGLDRPLAPHHANRILTKEEKKQYWEKTITSTDEKNAFLFRQKSFDQGRTYYEKFNNIQSAILLNKDDTHDYLSRDIELKSILEKTDLSSKIDEVFDSNDSKVAGMLQELYINRNNQDESYRIVSELFTEYGLESELSDYDTKTKFLGLDRLVKLPIYRKLAEQSARIRFIRLSKELDNLCSLDANDESQFNDIYYSTLKSQDRINQLQGAPAMPASLQKQLTKMRSFEWATTKQTGIQMALFIGATMLISGCAAAGGGIGFLLGTVPGAVAGAAAGGAMCMPAMGSLLSASAIGMQGLMFKTTLEGYNEENKNLDLIRSFEELGLTNIGSANDRAYSKFWVAVEAAFLVPFLGWMAKGARITQKSVALAWEALAKQTGKKSIRSLPALYSQFKGVAGRFTEIEYAKYLLDFNPLPQNFDPLLNPLYEQIKNMRAMALKQNIAFPMPNMKQIIHAFDPSHQLYQVLAATRALSQKAATTLPENFSKALIDKRTAQITANYLGSGKFLESIGFHEVGAKRLSKYLHRYYDSRTIRSLGFNTYMQSAKNTMHRLYNFSSPETKQWFDKIPLWHAFQNFRFNRVKKLIDNEKLLTDILTELDTLIKNGGDLTTFIEKNIDDLDILFQALPYRVYEVPYTALIEGAIQSRVRPWFFMGRFDGIMLKRIFKSREVLLNEHYMQKAVKTLEIPLNEMKTVSLFNVMKGFTHSIEEVTLGTADKELADQYIQKYNQMLDAFYTRAYNKLKEGKHKTFLAGLNNATDLKNAIETGENIEQIHLLTRMIDQLNPKDVLEFESLKDPNGQALLRQMMEFDDVDGMEKMIRAMRMLFLAEAPQFKFL